MSFVYIAPLADKVAFKIGKSSKPEERIFQLNRFYKFDFNNISIIDCKENIDAFRLENLLHSACDNKRIIYDYDGGTEFFDYTIYDKIMEIVKNVLGILQYPINKMRPIVDIKNIKNRKSVEDDEIETLLVSITNKIRNKRLGYNMTQKQLAKVTGLGIRTIRYLEANRKINLTTFIKVLKALDLDYLFSELEVDIPSRERASNK